MRRRRGDVRRERLEPSLNGRDGVVHRSRARCRRARSSWPADGRRRSHSPRPRSSERRRCHPAAAEAARRPRRHDNDERNATQARPIRIFSIATPLRTEPLRRRGPARAWPALLRASPPGSTARRRRRSRSRPPEHESIGRSGRVSPPASAPLRPRALAAPARLRPPASPRAEVRLDEITRHAADATTGGPLRKRQNV